MYIDKQVIFLSKYFTFHGVFVLVLFCLLALLDCRFDWF